MTVELQIEKGIPIPEGNQSEKYVHLFRKMDVGDSFFVSGNAQTSVMGCAIHYFKGSGYVKTRKEGNGYRVWRIK